jgi:hypothetical protein
LISSATVAVPITGHGHDTIGVQIPAGKGYLPVAYSNTVQSGVSGTNANLFGAGYVCPLSKRTTLYGYLSSRK